MKTTHQAIAIASLLLFCLHAPAQQRPGASVPDAVVTPGAKAKPALATQAAPVATNPYLSAEQRKLIQDYYAGRYQRNKRCPPGLAKKNNGCMPPGQAKKWAMGQPLPTDVVHAPLPEELRRKIGVLEKGIEIVRILNDVVVLNKGNRLVVDAVEILGQR